MSNAVGLIEHSSRYTLEETMERLQSLFAENGLQVFAVIDHSGEAEKVGLNMRPTKLLIFGSPKAGTPLVVATPSLAIDLPLKVLVAKDAHGKVLVTYNDPECAFLRIDQESCWRRRLDRQGCGIMLASDAVNDDFNRNSKVNPNRARDHLANERTFLAWVQTGAAIVVFGFAIGRFSIALRQLTALQGHPIYRSGISVWMGAGSIVLGVLLAVAGLFRYHKTRERLDEGTFEPAGFVLDLVTILTVVFGLVLAGYLIYIERSVG